jgi:hypothetical protein
VIEAAKRKKVIWGQFDETVLAVIAVDSYQIVILMGL